MPNTTKWKLILYYLLLCGSAVYVNVPIVALLALPVMAIVLILLIMNILSLKAEYHSVFGAFLITIGVLGIGFALAQFSIEYTGYLLSLARHTTQRFYPSLIATFFPSLLLGCIAMVLFLLGLQGRFALRKNTLYKISFAVLLSPLLVWIGITILYLTDYPLSD